METTTEDQTQEPEYGTPEWIAWWQKTCRDAARATQERVAALMPTLRGLGYTAVTVSYDGSGDDGHTVEVNCTPDNSLTPSLRRLVVDVAHELAPDGYENGEGAMGDIVIDLVNNRVTHTHNVRYIEFETSTNTFTDSGEDEDEDEEE